MKASYSRYRDLSLVDLGENRTLVIACDSAGAIGAKEADAVKVPGYVLGRFTARVALMEVIAVGALPVSVVSTLCVEPDPSGLEINMGVRQELLELELDPEQVLTGSSEKNIPTTQSGIGVTVVGLGHTRELKMRRVESGDSVAIIGLPKVGQEVSLDDPDIVDLKTVKQLVRASYIKEVVPVGSRGVLVEALELAKLYGLQLKTFPVADCVDVYKSAGPATCALVIGQELEQLVTRQPKFMLGIMS